MDTVRPASDLEHSGFFAWRTALLPFDEFLSWSRDLAAPSTAEQADALADALTHDEQRLHERLREVVRRPHVREALFVASPSLDEQIDRWLDRSTGDCSSGDRSRKIELALVRYFSRMTGRSTPFGLFAGCSVGRVAAQTDLTVEDRGLCRRQTRLDMEYLFALAESLARDPALRRQLVLVPNSTLYRAAGRVRYAESRFDGRARSHHLVAVEETDYLSATLERAAQGAQFGELAEALTSDEITLDEAEAYVDDLIDNQVLVPRLAPPVTGQTPIATLIEELSRIGAMPEATDLLRRAQAAIADIDAAGLGVHSSSYRAIAELLEPLPAKIDLSRLFQVDLVKPSPRATLGQCVIDDLLDGVDVLRGLADRDSYDVMKRFREAFAERYGDREVPLVEALDEEVGIGFDRSESPAAEASPLVEGLAFPMRLVPRNDWTAKHAVLLEKLCEAATVGSQEITLTSADLERMQSSAPPQLPDAFSVMASLAATSGEELAAGHYELLLQGTNGPSGARLLGRFCQGDPELHEHVRRHLRAEEGLEPDAVFAEVVHLPEGRIGNVLLRPLLRDYEIPFLGSSGAADERQFPITDLAVSIVEGRVVLRSRRFDRVVIPRLTSAHNYTQGSLGIYKFLGALQGQGVAGGLSWDWGPLAAAPFLPRVRYGRVVLSRATWRLTKSEIDELTNAEGTRRFAAAQQWRARRCLPRFIVLADGDNELPIDLDNVLSVETLVDLLKSRGEAMLVEMFPAPDELSARGSEGRFVHELVVPFIRKVNNSETPAAPRVAASRSVERTLAPGSNWLYAKLYTGTATADQVLRELVMPLKATAIDSGAARSWFFIRYGDPHWHLRLRFEGDPERLATEVRPALERAAAALLEDGRLWRVQFDTYEREIERYGGPDGIELAEQMFCADSDAILEILDHLGGEQGLDARWRLALRGIDMLLDDWGLDLAAKHRLMAEAREGFGREFAADDALRHQLSQRFRRERRDLEKLLDMAPADDPTATPLLEAHDHRSHRLRPLIEALRSCETAGLLTTSIESLALSHVHMHANRLLRSAHRAQELVIYDFLTRIYESRQARAAKQRRKPLAA